MLVKIKGLLRLWIVFCQNHEMVYPNLSESVSLAFTNSSRIEQKREKCL